MRWIDHGSIVMSAGHLDVSLTAELKSQNATEGGITLGRRTCTSTLDAGAGSGSVFLDDLRIRDRNLLSNGGFEVRSRDGNEIHVPGWSFDPPLGRVVSPALARAGHRSLELAPRSTYSQITQEITHAPGRSYRVSGWYRTVGALAPSSISFIAREANEHTTSINVPLNTGPYALFQQISRACLQGR